MCPSNEHSVDPAALPYSSPSNLPECMYAGTLATGDLSKEVDSNMFYWFFRQSTSGPLILWINGGPGSSSMFGLFLENGPLRVTRNGTGDDDFEIKMTEESWARINDYNVIYLDNPVNTGFSYGNSYLTNMTDISN